MGEVVLQCESVSKAYREGSHQLVVLDGVSFDLSAGRSTAIIGRSGSGKSTLLHVLAGLDTPDEGRVMVAGHDMTAADSDARAQLRGAHMGFVYQNHHLLPSTLSLVKP